MVIELHQLLRHHQSGHFRTMRRFVTERARPMDHLIIWILHGGLNGTIGDKDIRAHTGDLVILDPGVPQRYGPGQHGGWEWLWVHYGGAAAAELADRIRGSRGLVVSLGLDEAIRARFLELVATGNAAGQHRPDLRVDSCLYSLLGLIVDRAERLAAGARHPERTDLAGIFEFVNDRLAEPLSLDGLAAHTGYSPTHLNRLFHEQAGTSPMHYVSSLRMTRAATLLEVSTLTIAEIANAVGFADPYHFSRRFKQATGHAPSHYRSAHRHK